MENNPFTFYLALLSLALLLGLGIVLLVVVQKQRQGRLIMRQRELELKHAHDITRARVDVQEQAMSLICDEIHDHVGQILTAALGYQQRFLSFPEDRRDRTWLIESGDLIRKSIGEIRNISHSLNSHLVLEMGLIRSVSREVESMNDLGIHAEFHLEGDVHPLAREQDLLIYRIIQESIQNIMKHSQATVSSILFQFLPGALKLVICDNGKGFMLEKINNGYHYGLMSIRNRATLLKATLDITTTPGHGTILEFLIPV